MRRRPDTLPPPRPMALSPEILYLGDNGRVHCGAVRCAGHTAAATGVGLDGEPCVPVTRAEWLGWCAVIQEPMACEGCGLEATGVPGPTGAVLTRERQSSPLAPPQAAPTARCEHGDVCACDEDPDDPQGAYEP